MKNAMKKLMSVLLVAVLLISAVPFAASADGTNHNVTVVIKYGDSVLANKAVEITDGETCEGVMSWVANNAGVDLSKYDVMRYYWEDADGSTNNGEYPGETPIHLDGTLSVRLTAKVEETPSTPTTTPTEPTVEAVKFVVKVSKTGADNTGDIVYTGTKVPANGVSCKVGDLLSYCWNSAWTGVYKFDHAFNVTKSARTTNKDTVVAAGEEVHIMLVPDTTTSDTPSSGSTNSGSTSTGTSTKNQNDILLNIFINNDFTSCKTVKLNDHSVLDDDKITLNEIMNNVVTTYYKAKDSNKGLVGDGLYYTTGSYMYNWLYDLNKVNSIDNIAQKRAEGTVSINIMVTNAVAKSTTTTADSSNPKTGDSIYTAMTVMGISAVSLAAVMYIYNKKRQAI